MSYHPYTIMVDAPTAPAASPGGRPWAPERLAMDQLGAGHHFTITDGTRVNAARCASRTLRPKKFTVRKLLDGSGWRVQRIL